MKLATNLIIFHYEKNYCNFSHVGGDAVGM